MTLPLSRDLTFVDGVTPIPAATMNAIQDAIVSDYAHSGGGVFGDGSDGDLTFDGVTTVLGLVPASTTYTLNRDIYANSILMTISGKIYTNGFRIFVKNTLTLGQYNSINCDGKGSVGAVGGLASGGPGGTLGYGRAGGNGAFGLANGNNAPSLTGLSYSAPGGNGGSAPGTSGGLGTTASNSPQVYNGSPRSYSPSTFGYVIGGGLGAYPSAGVVSLILDGGPGGGGGASGTLSVNGGGGAGGAGVVAVAARNISIYYSDNFTANGGGGSPGPSGNTGGGGGGSGGLILLAYAILTNANPSPTMTAANIAHGGSPGLGSGTGNAGVIGGVGAVYLLQVI